MDISKNGLLSKNELELFLKELDFDNTDINSFFKITDSNNDGYVDQNEFLKAASALIHLKNHVQKWVQKPQKNKNYLTISNPF